MTPFERDLVAALSRLRRWARGMARTRADTDDLVQEAAARALAYRDRFEPGTDLGAWLYVVMRNVNREAAKRRRRETPDEGFAASLLPDVLDPEKILAGRQALGALARVPPALRATVVRAGLGDDYEEIAAALGVPIGTVKSRVHRGRSRLAAELGEGAP